MKRDNKIKDRHTLYTKSTQHHTKQSKLHYSGK